MINFHPATAAFLANPILPYLFENRGVKIGIVNLHPVAYFPKLDRIEYSREMEVTVTFTTSAALDLKSLRFRATHHDMLKLGVENPDAIREHLESGKTVNVNMAPSLQQMLLDPSESYQYVVITNEAMRDATTDVTVNDLINQRAAPGLTTKPVIIESILTDYSGVDDAEKVRNFIIDAYTNWETEYVLLGGDVNIIPIRDLCSMNTSVVRKVLIVDKGDGSIRTSWEINESTSGICNGSTQGTVHILNTKNNALETRDVQTGALISSLPLNYYGSDLTYSRSLDILYISYNGTHYLINPHTGELLGSFGMDYYMRIAADEVSATSWISISDWGGVSPAKGRFSFTVSLNSTHKEPKTCRGSITITHEKGWEPGSFVIPVEMTVLPLRLISAEPSSVDFGTVTVGSEAVETITLRNDGNQATTVSDVTSGNAANHLQTGSSVPHGNQNVKVPVTIPTAGPLTSPLHAVGLMVTSSWNAPFFTPAPTVGVNGAYVV